MSELSLLPPLPPSMPQTPTAEVPSQLASPSGSPHGYPTRTVAIIKNHALEHRLDIEPRILEASFEIVKERQMEFDMETDPEALYELFGEDARSFAEGPVWVYVLERRRAVEVWKTLMGPADPAEAKATAPNSLRALYGLSLEQNGFMGSPDLETAEIQIASLFASSPPFPSTELPDDLASPSSQFASGSVRSMSSSVMSALRKSTSENGSGKTGFKARAIPATVLAPSIQPRQSRAALLRAGVQVDKVQVGKRAPLTKEQLAKTFADVPGHKFRSGSITVASTAPPTIAPRMTRAASLRIGKGGVDATPKPIKTRSVSNEETGKVAAEKKAGFEGVPGHKRRETITVASVKAPTVPPRMNRSAALRAMKDSAPPSSFNLRTSFDQAPPSRSSSRQSMSGPRPSLSRPPSQAKVTPPAAPRPSVSRTTSRASISRSVSKDDISTPAKSTASSTANEEKPKPKPRPSSLQGPVLAPRTNKSALLRAAKMAKEAAEKAAAPVKGMKSKPAKAVAA
ncbi:hypothetical protein GLOTRDRAFT_121687 [Gloeophyllum trabeum ATCC 11539]|uniref:Nucleoside diphosphate kinase n=1 Tax=Gloeophyllum trabeum (strain ATCC 11539 / FP-39264 / Madison 617) TaxID=670483 RepID=S7Q3P2_GLOTA|nr:uncharacterized protein GLOTRDRAFT_121687 [Gloeophyllum trabeum ATCC 11539]EPQ54611.1 hypothetical protein GLOTRDRAFT_121687 [Gloeophyllum trabeum ATCC 11539]